MSKVIITIDGPAASGKSTVALSVARRLGYTYVDSGALYRGVAWKLLQLGVNPDDRNDVRTSLGKIEMDFLVEEKAVQIRIDGNALGSALRSEEVSEVSSRIAVVPEVRNYVVSHLREMAGLGNLVVEGRDIGTVVFPNARFKFYLDAAPEERARRRHAQFASKESTGYDVRKVLDSLKSRDERDSSRQVAPLKIAENAAVIDTTRMTIAGVVDKIEKKVRKKDKRMTKIKE